MGKLNGKVAWITGAGSGIGAAGAVALAEGGATVVLSGRRMDALERTLAAVTNAGGTGEIRQLDVADRAAVYAAAEAILSAHGKVDILVNSAGINIPKRSWTAVDPAEFAKLMDINVDGTFYTVHALLPSMRLRKDGLVINVSSWAGRFASPLTGPAYTGSKFAVVAMTHELNMEECMNGIRACCICPGEVATEIMDKRPIPPSAEDRATMVQAEDMGATIRFVAEMHPRVCINEILISPTWNRMFVAQLKNMPN